MKDGSITDNFFFFRSERSRNLQRYFSLWRQGREQSRAGQGGSTRQSHGMLKKREKGKMKDRRRE